MYMMQTAQKLSILVYIVTKGTQYCIKNVYKHINFVYVNYAVV